MTGGEKNNLDKTLIEIRRRISEIAHIHNQNLTTTVILPKKNNQNHKHTKSNTLKALAEQLENPSKEENWQRLDLLATSRSFDSPFNPPPARKSSLKQHETEEGDMTVEDVIEAVNVTDDAVVDMLAKLEDDNNSDEESEINPYKTIKQNSQS